MEWVVLILFEWAPIAIPSGIITAVIASNKGRSTLLWFLSCLLLGPIGIILILIVSKNESVLENRALKSGKMKKCQFCAELIKPEANTCRYCGKDVTNTNISTIKRHD